MNIFSAKRIKTVLSLLLAVIATFVQIDTGARPPASSDTIPSSRKRQQMVLQLEMENGGMLPSNEVIKNDFNDIYYNGANLRIGWQTERGMDPYHQLYNYPIYGIGFYASTFHKKEIGTPYAVYGFVAIPVKPESLKKWDFNYRISLGVADNFEPYHKENNPMNILLGTHHNVYIDLGIQANYTLNRHLKLGAGFAFHHFSNGSIRQPNKGINLVPLTMALTYRPSLKTPDLSPDPAAIFHNGSQYHIHYAAGIKQFNPDDSKRYLKSTLGMYWSLASGAKWRLGAGADLFYSDSGRDPTIAGNAAGTLGALFSGGPAFYIDHVLTRNLYINGNVGWYVHRNRFNGENNPVFLRIGVRHYVVSNVYAGVSIKAHMGKADFIEWTLGYTLGRKAGAGN